MYTQSYRLLSMHYCDDKKVAVHPALYNQFLWSTYTYTGWCDAIQCTKSVVGTQSSPHPLARRYVRAHVRISYHSVLYCHCYRCNMVQCATCVNAHRLLSLTWNQSMVQQLMREGNILSRLRKASPMGLIARTTWRFWRTRSMNRLYMANGVASIFLPWVL